jgi:NAD/NADP transhydrogenase beta subunit
MILSYIMRKAMNWSLANVILGAYPACRKGFPSTFNGAH